MKYTVQYIRWSNGEHLVVEHSATAPYVPQLKTIVVVDGEAYQVAVIESELVEQRGAGDGPAGLARDWSITVKLAKM